jgi:tryptophan synthase alpha chain
VTDRPVLIGFGISTPAHAVTASAYADGVVVASALMRRYMDGATPDDLGDQVAAMRSALDAM